VGAQAGGTSGPGGGRLGPGERRSQRCGLARLGRPRLGAVVERRRARAGARGGGARWRARERRLGWARTPGRRARASRLRGGSVARAAGTGGARMSARELRQGAGARLEAGWRRLLARARAAGSSRARGACAKGAEAGTGEARADRHGRVDTSWCTVVSRAGTARVARASSAGARRALVACEAWHGSTLARVRRQAGRAETRVSRAQERELERSTVETARRLGSGAGRNRCWSEQWRR
jgi:hypothetical protein